MQLRLSLLITGAFLLLLACRGGGPDPAEVGSPKPASRFELDSPAFSEGETIPSRFTCAGDDVSPPLRWSDPPADTKSIALILDDPDAPGGLFTHWMIFNIPPDQSSLEASVSTEPRLSSGARQARNDFGETGYRGPCPPGGSTHTYRFFGYALDGILELDPGASKADLLDAIQPRLLDRATLTGEFGQ